MFLALHIILLQVVAFPLFMIFGPIIRIWRYISLESEFWLETSLKRHEKEVGKIVEQVKVWIQSGRGSKMTTARPGWKNISLTKTDKSKYFQVHIGLDRIITWKENEESITVEPGVIIGQLSRYLFKRGWTIPVVPELDSLSIGGLICGVGIESSSHKRGLFHETVLSYEVVLADGSVVTCSKDKESDLFHAMPGSFATIGFLTAVTIPIIPAKRFVKLNYRPASSIAGLNSLLSCPGLRHKEKARHSPISL
ncbi:delta(24)-sterol reductase isoform X2 [Folsomia candida]|uniref:delta(24)-sterol reductase isoform X2 n=1 Tax=Folsomia candida TaxID=158441 RepID=UPI001604ADD2|nr:delta(24)-sterol reductase isoform X2 [Folsomia candida]